MLRWRGRTFSGSARALSAILMLLLAFGAVLSGGPLIAKGYAHGATDDLDAPVSSSESDRGSDSESDERDAIVEPVREEAETALAAMQRRVQRIFDNLAAVIAPQHPAVTDYTIEPVIEKIPNAWINRNNEIYVTSGLLELLPDDDELAGVIGHEIAHGTEEHIPHRINQNLWSLFTVLALGTIASVQGSSDWGGLLHMRDLFMYAFSREQESKADLVGMRYARAAGYREDGLVDALRAMDRERKRLPQDSIWQELYRTHPPISQRVMDLRLVLTMDKLDRMPREGRGLFSAGGLASFGSGSSGTDEGALSSPEQVILGFSKALFHGDEAGLRPYVLPGRAEEMLSRARSEGNGFDWTEAELEVVARSEADFSMEYVVRLWRSATADEIATGRGQGPDDVEMASEPLRVTLQQSVRGWVVTSWQAADEGEL